MERRGNKANAYKKICLQVNKCDGNVKKEQEKMQDKNECLWAVGLRGMWFSIKQG